MEQVDLIFFCQHGRHHGLSLITIWKSGFYYQSVIVLIPVSNVVPGNCQVCYDRGCLIFVMISIIDSFILISNRWQDFFNLMISKKKSKE